MKRAVMWVALWLLMASTLALAVPIEGIVLVNAVNVDGYYSYFMDGDTETNIAAPAQFQYGRMSPTLDKVVYYLRDGLPPTWANVWTANLDGNGAVNITADLGDVNCNPEWSPDSSKIAFQRSVLAPGLSPCESGFETWVMNADGSDAHRVSPLGIEAVGPSWASDGYRIICGGKDGTYIVDGDGTDWQALSEVGGDAAWSPDNAYIASVTYVPDTVDGEVGVWRNLLVNDADGQNPVTLRQHFVRDSDIATYFAQDRPPEPEGTDPVISLRCFVGINNPTWSPRGDQIIFREIVNFNPYGIAYQFQTELWLYDFPTDIFTQLTHNEIAECETSWGGYNTKPDQLTVAVGAVTISFDQVLEPGVTVVLRDDDPPDIEGEMLFDGSYYEIRTTATITGPVTVCMTYTDAAVPEGMAEEDLAILHWDGEAWVDVTAAKDTAANTICAQLPHLSPVALSGERIARFSDVPAWGYGTDGLSPYWAYFAIQACADGGVVTGYPDGTYQPTGQVDRAQMAVYIARALAGNEGNIPLFAGTPTFTDVGENHWALKQIEYAVSHGVVQGYEDGYHPAEIVTRAQLPVYVARARGWLMLGDDMATAPDLFPDVLAGFWSGQAIEECVAHGVVQGYDDRYYRPNEQVTRDQMAVYVARAFDL